MVLMWIVRLDFIREERGNIQHDDANGKAALRLHAVASDVLVLYNVTALGDVPWRSVVYTGRVDGVGSGLDVDAVCPQAHECDVERKREDWEKDFEEPEGHLDKPEEGAHYANHEMILSVAVRLLANTRELRFESWTRWYSQAAPYKRRINGSIVCICIYDSARIRIEAHLSSHSP